MKPAKNEIIFDKNAKWKFIDSDGTYKLYSTEINRMIEESFKENYALLMSPGHEEYTISVKGVAGGMNFDVQLSSVGVHRELVQEKQVFRIVKREGEELGLNKPILTYFRWLWLHSDGNFRPHENDATFLIEHCYNEYEKMNKYGISTVVVQGANGKSYIVDYSTFWQFNAATGFKIRIKRELI